MCTCRQRRRQVNPAGVGAGPWRPSTRKPRTVPLGLGHLASRVRRPPGSRCDCRWRLFPCRYRALRNSTPLLLPQHYPSRAERPQGRERLCTSRVTAHLRCVARKHRCTNRDLSTATAVIGQLDDWRCLTAFERAKYKPLGRHIGYRICTTNEGCTQRFRKGKTHETLRRA